MSRRRARRRLPCPGCGREVSVSMIDPLYGPLLWRRHNDPDTGERCLDAAGRDHRRAERA